MVCVWYILIYSSLLYYLCYLVVYIGRTKYLVYYVMSLDATKLFGNYIYTVGFLTLLVAGGTMGDLGFRIRPVTFTWPCSKSGGSRGLASADGFVVILHDLPWPTHNAQISLSHAMANPQHATHPACPKTYHPWWQSSSKVVGADHQ